MVRGWVLALEKLHDRITAKYLWGKKISWLIHIKLSKFFTYIRSHVRQENGDNSRVSAKFLGER